jgi:hypothetical protein
MPGKLQTASVLILGAAAFFAPMRAPNDRRLAQQDFAKEAAAKFDSQVFSIVSAAEFESQVFSIVSAKWNGPLLDVTFKHEVLDLEVLVGYADRPWQFLHCHFWDANGAKIDEECLIEYMHTPAFCVRKERLEVRSFSIQVPPETKSFAIQYGKGRWITKRVPLPPRR